LAKKRLHVTTFYLKGVHLLRCDPDSVVNGLRPQRLDTLLLEGLEQVIEHFLTPAHETRCKGAPEGPAGAFKHSLSCHVGGPLTWPVVAVSITLNGQSPPFLAFDNEVNEVTSARNLRLNAVAALHQLVEYFTLKAGLALVAQRLERLA